MNRTGHGPSGPEANKLSWPEKAMKNLRESRLMAIAAIAASALLSACGNNGEVQAAPDKPTVVATATAESAEPTPSPTPEKIEELSTAPEEDLAKDEPRYILTADKDGVSFNQDPSLVDSEGEGPRVAETYLNAINEAFKTITEEDKGKFADRYKLDPTYNGEDLLSLSVTSPNTYCQGRATKIAGLFVSEVLDPTSANEMVQAYGERAVIPENEREGITEWSEELKETAEKLVIESIRQEAVGKEGPTVQYRLTDQDKARITLNTIDPETVTQQYKNPIYKELEDNGFVPDINPNDFRMYRIFVPVTRIFSYGLDGGVKSEEITLVLFATKVRGEGYTIVSGVSSANSSGI